MSVNIKKRNWALVVYPDSLPENWKDFLIETGLPVAISPLHNQDINESTGEVKKAHRHVIVCYSGPTSFNVVNKSICEKLNAPIPKAIESVKGAYRYLTHKDNPEKAQYDEKEIICLNGFSILDFADLTRSEVLTFKKMGLDLIRNRDFYEYSDLVDYCYDNDLTDLLDVVSCHTVFFNQYLTSRRNKAKEDLKRERTVLFQATQDYLNNDVISDSKVKELSSFFGSVKVEED